MDDRRHHDEPGRDEDHLDREAAELLVAAGPRPEIPEEDLEAIIAAGRRVWRAGVEEREAAQRARFLPAAGWAVGLAAALALAVGIGWWWVAGGGPGGQGADDPPGGAAMVVARVIGAWEAPSTSKPGFEGREMTAGSTVETGPAGGELPRRLALRLGPASGSDAGSDPDGGTELRLDEATRVRLVSATEVELEAGAVYVDTGSDGGRSLAVGTPYGTARDIGTRFLVRLDPQDAPLSVRVRDGRVELERRGALHEAGGGEEMVVRTDGSFARREAPGHGPAWDWVVATAPAFELEGSTLGELLAWVSRETGWRVRFSEPELAGSADAIVLHGDLNGLRPDQAPFAVLPGAGLEGELDDGVLVVRRGGGR
jgi:ferric-dicitrate binding protein FerR (iron transport regulator)